MKKISIVIISSGQEGVSLYNCFKKKKNINIIGIADLKGEGTDFSDAGKHGIAVSSALEDIVSLDHLDVIIETTNDPEISRRVHGLKNTGVQVIESSILELMISLKNKRNFFEAKFLSLLANVTDGILIIDKDGNITYMNDGFLKITGASEDELIGCNIFEKYNDSPMAQAIKHQRSIAGQQFVFDSAKEECCFTITPIVIGDNFSGVIGVFKEIPEIIKLTTELQRSSSIIEEIYDKINRINGLPDIGESDIVPIDRMEQVLLKKALTKFGHTVEGKKKAADALNISLATLYNKLKKYQIS